MTTLLHTCNDKLPEHGISLCICVARLLSTQHRVTIVGFMADHVTAVIKSLPKALATIKSVSVVLRLSTFIRAYAMSERGNCSNEEQKEQRIHKTVALAQHSATPTASGLL